jgi:hypothetical protein
MLTNITSYRHARSGTIFNGCNRVKHSETLKFHGLRKKRRFIRKREVVKKEEYITMLLFLSKTRIYANFNDNVTFSVSIGESSYDVVLWKQ